MMINTVQVKQILMLHDVVKGMMSSHDVVKGMMSHGYNMVVVARQTQVS